MGRDDNSDFASLITQIPIVTSPKPAPNQQPITLSPGARTTASDPKLPPIPTFSPKELRKQRIQDHRLRGRGKGSKSAFQKKQNTFPSFLQLPALKRVQQSFKQDFPQR